MKAQRLAIVLILSVLAACQAGSDSTKILLTVESDLSVPNDIDTIRMDLTSDGTAVTPSPSFPLTSQASLPIRLAVVPAHAKDAPFTAVAVALKNGKVVVTRTVTSKFIPNKVGTIQIFLGSDCIDVNCPASLTCQHGACVETWTPASQGADSGAPDAKSGADLTGAFETGDTKPTDAVDARDAGWGLETGVLADAGGDQSTPTILDADIVVDAGLLPDTGLGPDVAISTPDASPDAPIGTQPVVDAPMDASREVSNGAETTVIVPIDSSPAADTVATADTTVADTTLAVPDAATAPDTAPCTPAYTLSAQMNGGAASLTWSGPTASSFQVWRGSTAASLAYIGTVTTTRHTDSSSFTSGKSVYYQISAGNAPPACDNVSNVFEVIPCAPPSVTTTTYGNEVRLSWTDVGAPKYTVSHGPAFDQLTSSVEVTGLQYAITGVTTNQTVYVKVSSNNATCSTGDSAVVSGTPDGCMGRPTLPALTATPDFQQNVLSWPAATGGTGAVSYTLSFATSSTGPFTVLSAAASSPFAHTGLSNGTAYHYKLKPVDSAGCTTGETSPPVQATPSLAACQATFCEDFSTADSDKYSTGDWTKTDSALCATGSVGFTAGHMSLAAPSADQTIQARVILQSCSTAQPAKGGGIAVRAATSVGESAYNGNSYRMMFECDGVLRVRAGLDVIPGCEYTLPASPIGVWHTLKLSVQGSTVKGYMDDMNTPKFSCTDTSRTSGNAGLVWMRTSSFCADDIRITSP
jgi:hypothetical protein